MSRTTTGDLEAPAGIPRGAVLPLHPVLARMLVCAQVAERSAAGSARRPALRLTRELIGACVRSGVPADVLAACLHTSAGSVRNRVSGVDGVLTATQVHELTGFDAHRLAEQSGQQLRSRGTGLYGIEDVVRIVVRCPPAPANQED